MILTVILLNKNTGVIQ